MGQAAQGASALTSGVFGYSGDEAVGQYAAILLLLFLGYAAVLVALRLTRR